MNPYPTHMLWWNPRPRKSTRPKWRRKRMLTANDNSFDHGGGRGFLRKKPKI